MACECPQSLSEDDSNMCQTNNFYLWLLQVLGLLGLLALCLWLSLRPKSPKYVIVDFSVPTINNSLSDNGGLLLYSLEIQNPNKDSSIYYDDILLIFYNGQDRVGTNTIRSFHQGKGKTAQLADRVDVSSRAWNSLRNAILNATAQLKVGLVTRIQYKTWGQKSKHHGVNREGKVPIGKDGKISSKKKKIKLTHPSKKWRRATRFL